MPAPLRDVHLPSLEDIRSVAATRLSSVMGRAEAFFTPSSTPSLPPPGLQQQQPPQQTLEEVPPATPLVTRTSLRDTVNAAAARESVPATELAAADEEPAPGPEPSVSAEAGM